MAIKTMGNQMGIHLIQEPYQDNPEYGRHQMEPVVETPVKEIEQLFEKVEAYSNTTFELAKLKSLEGATKVVTSLVSKLAVLIVFSMFLVVINIGVSIYLGELMGKMYYGYFTVAIFNLVIAILLHLFLQPVINRTLGQTIIRQALD